MSDKKESLLEYLMTYGWAILILIIIGAALYALNIFNPGITKSCVGFDFFVYHDHTFSADGKNIQLQLGNLKDDVCIKEISIIDENGIEHLFNSFINNTSCNGEKGFLIMSNAKNITFSSVEGILGKQGSSYTNIIVKITYDVIDGIKNQLDTATCRGTFN